MNKATKTPSEIIFFGSSDFSIPSLAALIDAGHHVRLVVTTPDSESGRGKKLNPTPVKVYAHDHGLPCATPASLKKDEEIAAILATPHDFGIVASYGKIIPQRILDLSRIMPLNVHPSRLPLYRGASPLQYALLNGDHSTAVTIMKMVAKLDAGDIILQEEAGIDESENFATLSVRLAAVGARLLVQAIDEIRAGTARLTPQDEAAATFTKMITKEDGLIDFSLDSREIMNRIRAYTPWPSAYAFLEGKRMKISSAKVTPGTSNLKPGTILRCTTTGFVAVTGDGLVEIVRVQPEGKPEMDATGFANGCRWLVGACFATEKKKILATD